MVNVLLAAMAVVVYLAGRFALGEPAPTLEPLRVVVALLPLPFAAALLYRVVAGLRQLDEMQRLIQLQAMSIAFGLLVLTLMILGLLEVAGPLPAADWSYRHIWPIAFATYCGAVAVARKRFE